MDCVDRVFCRLAGLRLEELTLKLLSMTVSLFQLGFGKEGAVIHKGVICAGSVVLEVNEKRLVVVNVEKKAVLNVSGIEHKQVLDLSDDGKVMCSTINPVVGACCMTVRVRRSMKGS